MAPSAEPIIGLGARTDYLATAPGMRLDEATLTADERLVIGAVGRAATIEQIVTRCGLPEAKAIAVLLGLRARGVVVPARPAAPPPSGAVDASTVEAVDLDPDRKSEILALEGLIDTASHYDILGVDPRAAEEEIRRAYHEASRRFHPDRYFQKDLGSFRARIERLFRRVSEASSVLLDPERRRTYDRAHPELFDLARATPYPAGGSGPMTPVQPMPAAAGSPERAEERRSRLARHPYMMRGRQLRDLAKEAKETAARGDYTRAAALLNQAVQVDPANPELRAELAELRRKQDAARVKQELARGVELEGQGELEKAADQYQLAAAADPRNAEAAARAASVLLRTGGDLKEIKALAQRAVDLLPRSANHRVLLARVLLQADSKKLARRELEEAVRLDADHAEARTLLKKLKWPF
ncbi:MAG TPA: DnaJ domain-containing protein [Myxococcales bacterium]|nr:DnaJ domain-containing protein [Myxococcales bacterium]